MGNRVFDAWLTTDPAHNPNAPPGPSYIPQYVIPQQATANIDDSEADKAFAEGESGSSWLGYRRRRRAVTVSTRPQVVERAHRRGGKALVHAAADSIELRPEELGCAS